MDVENKYAHLTSFDLDNILKNMFHRKRSHFFYLSRQLILRGKFWYFDSKNRKHEKTKQGIDPDLAFTYEDFLGDFCIEGNEKDIKKLETFIDDSMDLGFLKKFPDFLRYEGREHVDIQKFFSNLQDIDSELRQLYTRLHSYDITNKASFSELSSSCNDLYLLYYILNKLDLKQFESGSKLLGQVLADFMRFLDIAGTELSRVANKLLGYWEAKRERSKAGIAGGRAKTEGKLRKIAQLKDYIDEVGVVTHKSVEVDKSEFHKILNEITGCPHTGPSTPTIKNYKEKIAELYSKEQGKTVSLVLKK